MLAQGLCANLYKRTNLLLPSNHDSTTDKKVLLYSHDPTTDPKVINPSPTKPTGHARPATINRPEQDSNRPRRARPPLLPSPSPRHRHAVVGVARGLGPGARRRGHLAAADRRGTAHQVDRGRLAASVLGSVQAAGQGGRGAQVQAQACSPAAEEDHSPLGRDVTGGPCAGAVA